MILGPSQWHDLYDGIRLDGHASTEKKITILVSGSDCDSLCALKILQVQSWLLRVYSSSVTCMDIMLLLVVMEFKFACWLEHSFGARVACCCKADIDVCRPFLCPATSPSPPS